MGRFRSKNLMLKIKFYRDWIAHCYCSYVLNLLNTANQSMPATIDQVYLYSEAKQFDSKLRFRLPETLLGLS